MAVQNGIDGRVEVSWTAPSEGGVYRVTADPGGISMDNSFSPQAITNVQPGVYNFSVMTLSRHFPGGIVGPVEVTVRGEYSYHNNYYS